MQHPDYRVEGEKCGSCGAPWQRRPGDGYMLSVYHAATCKHAIPRDEAATQERAHPNQQDKGS